MRANRIGVDGACIEFHLLGQGVRNDAIDKLMIVRRSLPIILIVIQSNVLIRFPLPEDKRTASDRVTIEPALTYGEMLRILPGLNGLFLEGLIVEELIRDD